MTRTTATQCPNLIGILALGAFIGVGCGEEPAVHGTGEPTGDTPMVEWNVDAPGNQATCAGSGGRCQTADLPCDPVSEMYAGPALCGGGGNDGVCCLPRVSPAAVDVDELLGNWVYAVEGSTGTSLTWFIFDTSAVSHVAEWVRYGEEIVREVQFVGSGNYEVTFFGTIRFEYGGETPWGRESHSRSHTFTVLDLDLYERLGGWAWWVDEPDAERIWSFQSYLAQDESYRYFRRENAQRLLVDGELEYDYGYTTELTFNVPVTELADAETCELSVVIRAEATAEGSRQSGTERFELTCAFTLDSETGLGRVTIVGLGENAADWSNHLYDFPLYEEYPWEVFNQFQEGFEPLIFVDTEDPTMIHHRPSGFDSLIYTSDEPSAGSSGT